MIKAERIKTLCQASQLELLHSMKYYLHNNGYDKIVQTDDFLYAEGDIPIAICAHLDTVGVLEPVDIFYDQEQGVMWSPQLLGADDRAGVEAICSIVEDGYRPCIILTTEEEIGGLGAQAFTTSGLKPVWKFIIEIDRKGLKEAVYYQCGNADFKKTINSYGFYEKKGTFSDIYFLGPAFNVACVNLSAGYYNEHTHEEYLNLNHLIETTERVKRILADNDELKYYTFMNKFDSIF